MSLLLLPLEVIDHLFSQIEKTVDAIPLALSCRKCYDCFINIDVPRRVKRALQDDHYLEKLAENCDPVLFLCDISSTTIPMRLDELVLFEIPKTFAVLKKLFFVAEPSFLQKFLSFHPINVNKVATKIWFERHLCDIMKRKSPVGPVILDMMLDYIVIHFKPFRDYFPCKTSAFSYQDTKEDTSKITKIYKPVNTLQDYIVEIMTMLGKEACIHPDFPYYSILQKYIKLCSTFAPFMKAIEESKNPTEEFRNQMKILYGAFFGYEPKQEELDGFLRRIFEETFADQGIPDQFSRLLSVGDQ